MFKKTVLKNGLRLILVPQPSSLASTVLVLVEAGSEYETKAINGLSHFLEHMMFKGTVKRPNPGTISTELDALGAEYNAFTGQEYTGYWAKAQYHKLPHLLDLICDLYLNPIFNPAEIDKERGVVIEEINMYEDTPMRRVEELFTNLLYGNQPAGWDIAGKKEVIRKLRRHNFLKYRAERYVMPSTIVVVAGNFKEKEIKKWITECFKHVKREKALPKPKTREHQVKPQTLVKFKGSDQSHLVLGVRTFNIFDKRRAALQVMSEVLGGGMSSRLFHRVREVLGAAYYVRSNPEFFLDHGYLAISSGVDNTRIETVMSAILDELGRLATELVPAAELRKAKDHMIGNLILRLETSDELAGFYGGQEIVQRSVMTHEALIKVIEKVTAEEIQAVAKAIFKDDRLNLAVIGPYKDARPFRKLLTFKK